MKFNIKNIQITLLALAINNVKATHIIKRSVDPSLLNGIY